MKFKSNDKKSICDTKVDQPKPIESKPGLKSIFHFIISTEWLSFFEFLKDMYNLSLTKCICLMLIYLQPRSNQHWFLIFSKFITHFQTQSAWMVWSLKKWKTRIVWFCVKMEIANQWHQKNSWSVLFPGKENPNQTLIEMNQTR